MKKLWTAVLTFILAVGMIAPQSMVFAEESPNTDGTDEEYSQNEVLVVYKSDKVSKGKIASVMSDDDGEVKSTIDISGTKKAAVVKIDSADTVDEAIEKYQDNPEVIYAQPNYKYKLQDTAVKSSEKKDIQSQINDTQANKQWYFSNINLEAAWNYIKSRSHSKVRVAVLDTGMAMSHEDLNTNVNKSLSVDATKTNLPALTGDDDGHGTHVAGIIGATSNNGKGVAGVASGYNNDIVEVMAVDVFTYDAAYTDDIIRGVNYASSKKAKVINMSLGYATTSPKDDYDKLMEDAIDTAVAGGTNVVCAAGNDNNDVTNYPSDFDSVISVININASNQRDSTSNYGKAKDISAPGDQIYSTLPSSGYGDKSGTSMATPVISGVIAIMLSEDPGKTPAQVKNKLYATAKDLGTPGFDIYYGNGLVDAGKALSGQIVSFDANGGKVGKAYNTISYGNTFGALPTPSKTGYTFTGWYTAKSSGTKVTESTKVTSNRDQVLYAHWTAKKYTVKYNANGGKISTGSKNVTYGMTYGTLKKPARKGYIFAGWYTKKKGGAKVKSSTKVSKTYNHTLYAHWTNNTKTLTISGKPAYRVTSGRLIKVSWKKKAGVKGYVIYQSKNNGAYKKLRLVGGNKGSVKFVVKAGAKYKFKVKPYTINKGKMVKGAYRKATKKELNKAVEALFKKISKYNKYVIQMKWGKKNKSTGKWKWTGWKKMKTFTSAATGQLNYVKNKSKLGYSYKARIKGYKTVNGKKVYTVIKCVKIK